MIEMQSSASLASNDQRRRRHWLRRLLRPLLILLLAASGIVVLAYRFGQTTSQAPNSLTLLGNIDVRQVNLGFKVGGRIAALAVDEGDSVETGQLLATLDKQYFEDSLHLAEAQRNQAQANFDRLQNGSRPEEIEQARAQTATAQAALLRAEQDHARSTTLIAQKAIAAADFDATRAAFVEAKAAVNSAEAAQRLVELGPRVEDIAAGQAQLQAAEAQVVVSQRQLVDSQILAPHAGVILTRARESGAIVNVGETVFTLTLVSPVWVRTYIGEPDLGRIAPGMNVGVQTDGHSKQIHSGRVGYISPTAEFTPKTVETRELRTSLVYRVRIVIDAPDAGLRQGMPVTLTVAAEGTRQRSFKERMLEVVGLGGAQ